MVISYRTLSKQVLEAHARTSDNYKWLQENWENIRKDFSDQFIAIADRKIVYNTSVYAELLNYLSEHREQPDLIGVRVRPNDHILLL